MTEGYTASEFALGNEPRAEIDEAMGLRAVAGVFNRGAVLELVVGRLQGSGKAGPLLRDKPPISDLKRLAQGDKRFQKLAHPFCFRPRERPCDIFRGSGRG